MNEQPISSAELDQLLDRGLDHGTHQATLRKAARDVTGQKFTGESFAYLRQALEKRESERSNTVGGYVAVRRLTLQGVDYLPGDPIATDGLKDNTKRLLVTRKMIRMGGAS